MKITKYPQSCLKLEKGGRALMIDVGSFATAKFGLDDFGKIEALLVTHQHLDHIDADFAAELKEVDVPIFANADVVQKFPSLGITEIQDGAEFETAGFTVRPVDIPHCLMVDGSAGPPNTGFIIDGNFFHPGDGIEPKDVLVTSVAVPIAGPSITSKEAVEFITNVGAQRVIPIHYDNPTFTGDPHKFKNEVTGTEVIVLGNGESVDI